MERDIDVELIVGRGFRFRLLKPLAVQVRGLEIIVPSGMVSDGASIPRLFWRILPPFGPYLRGAVVHDYLYRSGIVTKDEADAILDEIAREDATPLWQRALIRFGLLIGGEKVWDGYAAFRSAGIDTVFLSPEE